MTIDEQTGELWKPVKEEEPKDDEFLCKTLLVEDIQAAKFTNVT